LTFLVYAISQICQIFLWLWAYAGPPVEKGSFAFLRKGGILDRSGFYSPTDFTSLLHQKRIVSLNSLWAFIWYSLAVIFGVSGVFTSIGGTMMQLMGVYRSDLCEVNAFWWTRPHDNFVVMLSSNSALAIKSADIYWKTCAITATVFLSTVCFGGWWYQRRLKALFRQLVKDIDNPRTDRQDVLEGGDPSENTEEVTEVVRAPGIREESIPN
jgi:hypothetical protein